jgi:hypothetical protein
VSGEPEYEFTPAGITVNVLVAIAIVLSCLVIVFALRDGNRGLALAGGGMVLTMLFAGYYNYLSERRKCTSDDDEDPA